MLLKHARFMKSLNLTILFINFVAAVSGSIWELEDRQYRIFCATCKADRADGPARERNTEPFEVVLIHSSSVVRVDDAIFEVLGLTLEDLQFFRALQLAGHFVKVCCRRSVFILNLFCSAIHFQQ
jgi:hypothetical protein